MENATTGHRKTSQREIIGKVFSDSEGPLTPQEILERAQKSNEKMGIATIYRTLKILLDSEDVRLVNLPDGQTRYELTALKHHHHFKCKLCKKIFDIKTCSFQMGQIKVPDGFVVENHEITLFGLCNECR